ELGRDISYEELKSLFDVVILAFGMEKPRLLDIPGADLPGVISATDFVGWYNATPKSKDCGDLVSRARSAIVVGNGNVALDVARLLAKTESELATTDIVPAAADAIVRAPLNDIYVVGRRGPIEASFSFPELSELGDLVEAQTLVDSAYLPVDASSAEESVRKKKERNLRVLRTFAGN
ncbi:MAG: FAD-dependent oxidoreductase, partial [Pseudomonadales bacterium]|nr:FAD-dependent oxidoreductase [Pseudomonadales bacterium]